MNMQYKYVAVNDFQIFYREIGKPDAPVILLLHGFPSSSRMYEQLMLLLSEQYRLIAPDYIGFGQSSWPSHVDFHYTFDNLSDVMLQFIEKLNLQQYTLVVQDYGGPIGFRIASQFPTRVNALIVQNAVAHAEGLGPLWDTRKAFWNDRDSYESQLKQNFVSLEATKLRHVGNSPNIELYNPDIWVDEHYFLSQPKQVDIQLDLFYDYQSNVKLYPHWQDYFKQYQPATLVVWGKHDPSFTIDGAYAYVKDIPSAEIHLLDGGHFVLEESCQQTAEIMKAFLQKLKNNVDKNA
ncbi:alpha/beta hydrolase [Acinetobacter qingfengensis]|uniref:Alpha/beta hydrolase n=1 Tax=Acinetobacter qingfengensis TaxID=1262585 RepID=A0A1E7R3H7_9GAMM|nr:alpha/beta hydrolase [Acinetobacter qingfengensis]KAA8735585.1 alpha/beta hydrolase [Acinetobacter qingfengensis]OEY93875.1 alpha/beta hydrolase [Acinetobacter qingfengensis]